MVNTEIRLIIFFVAKEKKKKKEEFYRRSFIQSAKIRWELTVAHIMNSLLLDSDLN